MWLVNGLTCERRSSLKEASSRNVVINLVMTGPTKKSVGKKNTPYI